MEKIIGYKNMCGGVGFSIKNIPDDELVKYYSPELLDRLKDKGRIESFFWYKDAVLPVKAKNDKRVQLKIWGNKMDDIKLPKTGWAKEESLAAGKWDYLHPESVDIAADSGYEKKVWFDLPEGTKGILVKKGGEERVYMITRQASEEYGKETGHDREPLGIKNNFRK